MADYVLMTDDGLLATEAYSFGDGRKKPRTTASLDKAWVWTNKVNAESAVPRFNQALGLQFTAIRKDRL